MNSGRIGEKSSLTSSEMALLKAVGNSVKNSNEVILEYKPNASNEKWLEHRFSDWNSTKSYFAYAVVFLFFAFAGPEQLNRAVAALSMVQIFHVSSSASALGTSSIAASTIGSQFVVLEFLCGAIGAAALALIAKKFTTPSHLRLNYDGVELHYKRPGISSFQSLKWDDMESIDMFYPTGKTSPQDCIVKFIGKPSSKSLALKLSAISSSDARNSLHSAIDKWAGNLSRSPHLIEVLTPAQDSSYTELWMQALSAPPKRERLTPLATGALLQDGRYSIVESLGVGGQGTAYLARVVSDGSEVVLKEFILPVYVDMNVRRQALDRMQNEATMLRRLDNPRVVRLHDFFVEDHRGYLVLERINGFSLRQLVIKNGAMPEDEVRELASQMCEILKYLHLLTPPVVHRDFTPDNLILGKDGILKLVDFNVAQQTENTATGTVVGKHCYLPPEQFRGKPTTQSDIYAMGATLYYLLLAQDPQPITSSHPILQNDKISGRMDDIVSRATCLDMKKRIVTASEIEELLEIPYF